MGKRKEDVWALEKGVLIGALYVALVSTIGVQVGKSLQARAALATPQQEKK